MSINCSKRFSSRPLAFISEQNCSASNVIIGVGVSNITTSTIEFESVSRLLLLLLLLLLFIFRRRRTLPEFCTTVVGTDVDDVEVGIVDGIRPNGVNT